MLSVGPWVELARAAGLVDVQPQEGLSEFIALVSDDPAVQDALHVLDGSLSSLLTFSYGCDEPFTGRALLAALAAAHADVPLPEGAREEVADLLAHMHDDGQLTRPMADLLQRLDPGALEPPDPFGHAGLLEEIAKAACTDVDQVVRVLAAVEGRIYPEPYEVMSVSFDVVGDQLRALRGQAGPTIDTVVLPYYGHEAPSPRIRPVVTASSATG